jgi:putative nucleotidyltransferase with HDIG domain
MLAHSIQSVPAGFEIFSVEKLIDNSTTDFDLYLKVGTHFILYGGSGYRWERDELSQLLRSGFDRFYMNLEDIPRAMMYERLARLPTVAKEQAPQQRIKSIEEVGAHFTKCLYSGDITPGTVAKGEELAKDLVGCIAEDIGCVKFLSGLANHDYYTYYHSIRVASYATAISIQMGLTSEAALRNIALGGIFHDIGKKDVPISVINKTGALTEAEWAQMRAHPLNGHELVKETTLDHVSQEIIVHHHERLNGAGYPHGLDSGSLLKEVQIAAVADIFDALTSSRSYQKSRTKYEALDFMKHKLLRTDVGVDVFKALVECLAT